MWHGEGVCKRVAARRVFGAVALNIAGAANAARCCRAGSPAKLSRSTQSASAPSKRAVYCISAEDVKKICANDTISESS